MQEVWTQDGLLHIGYDENPSECTTQSNVQSVGVYTICSDLGTVHCLQHECAVWTWVLYMHRRNQADFSISVNKETIMVVCM